MLDLNSKEVRIDFEWLKTPVEGQIFEIVKINRSNTKTGKPTAKLFCTAVGGVHDKKTAIKELITTANNLRRVRDFAIACGKYEMRTDEDGEQYKHVLISQIEQLQGCSFVADFINESQDPDKFFGLIHNEREMSIE